MNASGVRDGLSGDMLASSLHNLVNVNEEICGHRLLIGFLTIYCKQNTLNLRSNSLILLRKLMEFHRIFSHSTSSHQCNSIYVRGIELAVKSFHGHELDVNDSLESFLMDNNIIFNSNQCPNLAQFAYGKY